MSGHDKAPATDAGGEEGEAASPVGGGACSGCSRMGVPLLMCDDLATENSAPTPHNPMVNSKHRYCADCMIGKKVRVFWPLDEQWYVGVVREYDAATGEHLLTYPDGDTEWVKIGDTQTGSSSDGAAPPSEQPPPHDGGEHALVQSPPRIQSKSSPAGGVGPLSGVLPDSPQSGRTAEEGPPGSGRGHQQPPPPQHGYPPYPGGPYPPPHYGSPYGSQQPPPYYPPMGMSPPRASYPPPPQSKKSPGSGGKDGSPPAPTSSGSPPHPAAYPGAYAPQYPPAGGRSPGGGVAWGYQPPPPGAYGHQPPHAHHHHHHPSYGPPPPYGAYGAPPPPMGQPPMGGGGPMPPMPSSGGIGTASGGTSGSKGDGQTSSGTKKKSGPKTWTKEEDAILLDMVKSMRMPMKWSVVAQSMPGRTGKQCRERYVNHLNPRLKVAGWTPMEDATIFHLYNTTGSSWAKMAKMIPGRTDNGIKNRFHNIRRQLEREDEHRMKLSKAEDFPDEVRLERIREFPRHLRGKTDLLWDMHDGIGVLAAQSVLGSGIATRDATKKKFGPFRPADEKGEQCARCGLLAPSVQCGTEICDKTRWCESCTRLPSHLSGNLLRECLNLRRSQDAAMDKIIKSWGPSLGLEDSTKVK